MPQVMFRTTAAGPDGVFNAGKVYEISDAVAGPFIEHGYAHEVRPNGKGWERVSPTVPAPVTLPSPASLAPKAGKAAKPDVEDKADTSK